MRYPTPGAPRRRPWRVHLLLLLCFASLLPNPGHAWERWDAVQTLALGAPQANFGHAVAAGGGWLAVGAPGADDNSVSPGIENAGLVRMYRRQPDGTYVYSQLLFSPVPWTGASFGFSVALSGSRLMIGAPLHGADVRGRVEFWEFDADTDNWEFVVGYPGTSPFGMTGWDVAISNDRAAAGEPMVDADAMTPDSGRVQTWVRNAADTFFIPAQTVVPPAPASGGRFGYSVAIADFLLQFGGIAPDRLLVGEPRSFSAAQGLAWIFEIDAGAFAFSQLVAPPQGFDGVAFGVDVAMSGRINAVGAEQASTVTLVLRESDGDWTLLPPLDVPGVAPAKGSTPRGFGESIDLHGNGLLVGAPRDDLHAYGARAYIFDVLGDDVSWRGQLLQPGGEQDPWTEFGSALALDGLSAVVASPDGTVEGVPDAGRVAVYRQSYLFGDGFEVFE